MISHEHFIFFRKEVDKSLLTQGFSIGVKYQQELLFGIGTILEIGERKPVILNIAGKTFPAMLVNQNFDRQKYQHSPIIQVRYDSNKEITAWLRTIFPSSYESIFSQRDRLGGHSKAQIHASCPEYITVYPGGTNEIMVDCVADAEIARAQEALTKTGELELESILDAVDDTAGLTRQYKLVNIRHLCKSIGDHLKQRYNYQCQLCGRRVFDAYDSNLIHCHHIRPFAESMDNDVGNLMLVCPNHHYVIHEKHPDFNFRKLEYLYPNGYREKVKVDFHLRRMSLADSGKDNELQCPDGKA